MFFKQLFDTDSSTYSYLIADDVTHEAVLVDPVVEQLERDLDLLRAHRLQLKYTLDTHVHADHVTGALALRQATGAQTCVARDCNAHGYDRELKHGDVILFGREDITVLATPGHTPGSVCYLWRDRVFTGDTLLIGGCGRTDFQNGSAEALFDSITTVLFRLDDQTLVYPGHDYKGRRVSSIGEERQFNARIAGRSRQEFVAFMDALGLPAPRRIHEAVPANLRGGAADTAAMQPPPASPAIQSVSPLQLAQHPDEKRILDVRTPAEFGALRIAGSANLPFDRFDADALKSSVDVDCSLYCVCQTGTRSQLVAQALRRAGFRNVVHVNGGIIAWLAAGLPVERSGHATLPMERQVRIVAGVLVLLGVVGGALAHPAGYGFAALIGAGLAYSGLTNWCGLSMVLARMPWNGLRSEVGIT